MKYHFTSCFSKDIISYVKLRCSLGNQEDTYARRLYSFDCFCQEKYPHENKLTKEIAETWCTLLPTEKVRTLKIRTGILRGFAKYLISIGKDAYIIPDGFIGASEPFLPYLYTDEEMKNFFEAADALPPHPLSPYREYIVPVIFRMLYCCGLRPQEVRHLRRSDVVFSERSLWIVDSKRNKDRVVVMHSDLSEICIKYDELIDVYLPGRTFFFETVRGNKITTSWLQKQFHKCLQRANISYDISHRPRVSDWRHNFATRKIIQWMDEGKDVMKLMPYLSTYMGHSSIEHTSYYIHLIPSYLKTPELTDWTCNAEVPNYED